MTRAPGTAPLAFALCLLAVTGFALGIMARSGDSGRRHHDAWRLSWRPLSDTAPLVRVAFGSCLNQRFAQSIWTPIVEAKPDLFLMLGDNVYGDVSGPDLKELRNAYRLLAADPNFAKARNAMPFLATWDDHDYGRNDAGADFPFKGASARLFHDFWGLRTERALDTGLYYARMLGPPGKRVQIIMLDTRSFRSPLKRRPKGDRSGMPGRYLPDHDSGKTMLGSAQWSWLEARLREPADVRIIASSIQFLATSHGWERWGNFPHERQRLIDLIRTTKANGVIVLSGDRHRGGVYRLESGAGYPLVEVTSSALNYSFASADPADPLRLGDMFGHNNFGLVEIDWSRGAMRVSLRDEAGRIVRHFDLELKKLRAD